MMVLGAAAPDAMVWDHGGLVKARASSLRIMVDHFLVHLVYWIALGVTSLRPHYTGGCSCLALQCQHPP